MTLKLAGTSLPGWIGLGFGNGSSSSPMVNYDIIIL